MELACNEERMIRQLDHLDEPVAGEAWEPQPRVHQLLQVAVVELESVPMTLHDDIRTVDLMGARAVRQAHFLRPEPHRAAELRFFAALLDRPFLVLPLGDERDHGVRRGALEFGRIGTFEPRDVAGVLDDRKLHAETDAEIGNLLLACVTNRGNLAVDTAFAESARHEDCVDAFET